MLIADLQNDERLIAETAALLIAGFAGHRRHPWPDMPSALAEVRESVGAGRISRIATINQGAVVGWVGGISRYRGRVWEIHPLVVRPDMQGKGIGRALVNDLESVARARGALTLWVGTDDEDGLTTLWGMDPYPDLLGHLADIRSVGTHPFAFYRKLGFSLAGVMPDANGPGQPDIYLARKVGR